MVQQPSQDLYQILTHISALSEIPEPFALKRLIDALRVPKKELEEYLQSDASESKNSTNKDQDPNPANQKIQELIDILKKNPKLASDLALFCLNLLSQYRQLRMYSETGIAVEHEFWYGIKKLLGHKFIPLLPDKESVTELVAYLFNKRHDGRWLNSIDQEYFDTLTDLIRIDDEHQHLVATSKNHILNAMVFLSYRITALGLNPELLNRYPEQLNFSSAFVALNQETIKFVDDYRSKHQLDELLDTTPETDADSAPLLVMVEQCEDIVTYMDKRIYKTGVSIRMTNLLMRLEQSLERMRILVALLADHHKERDKGIAQMMQALVSTSQNRYSIRYLLEENTRILSRKVTENSGMVGEHYISTDKHGYHQMFKKAAIGGVLIAFMATMKILAYNIDLAPFGRMFINSMIYGLGFVLIHIIHGTVATKQPAMTAAAIATTISDGKGKGKGKRRHQLTKLSELIVDIMRTQFIAIMGNVLVAIPLAFAISWAWLWYTGSPMISFDMADHLLHELNPLLSLAIPHAAIAGIYLFLAGLIAGYYDNMAVFNQIGERLKRQWLLVKLLPKAKVERLGDFVEANLGAIMGNFLFGVFLGSTATIGYFLGLPLDIRHIAFSSANFAHGIFNMPAQDFTISILFISLLGVALIGLANLMVSFSLALMVALRSKDVQFMEWGRLFKQIMGHFFTHPMDFFYPRTLPMSYDKINNMGQLIYEDHQRKQSAYPSSVAMRRLKRELNKSKTNKPTANATTTNATTTNVANDKTLMDEKVAHLQQQKQQPNEIKKNGEEKSKLADLGKAEERLNAENQSENQSENQKNEPTKKQEVKKQETK